MFKLAIHNFEVSFCSSHLKSIRMFLQNKAVWTKEVSLRTSWWQHRKVKKKQQPNWQIALLHLINCQIYKLDLQKSTRSILERSIFNGVNPFWTSLHTEMISNSFRISTTFDLCIIILFRIVKRQQQANHS